MKKLLDDMKADLGEKIDKVGTDAVARDKTTRWIFGLVAGAIITALVVGAIVLANLYGTLR